MPDPVSAPPPPARRLPWPLLAGVAGGCLVALLVSLLAVDGGSVAGADEKDGKTAKAKDEKGGKGEKADDPPRRRVPAPELDGGVAWLNTARPLSLKDLRGRVVLLDFWTLCCINCIHILPDLHRLEQRFRDQLVVIGVHSPKFDNEKDTFSIRKAVLRYQIEHPVVNDADRKLWDRYEVDAWPTFVLIDPEGNLVGYTSGEGNYDLLETVIGRVVAEHRQKKTLNETPIRFDLARLREGGDTTPLYFPGKVTADADGKRLLIADSTHHRVVVTDLEGNAIAVAGTGQPGLKDGPFAAAQFDDPQGLAVRGDTVFVADRKNHAIRALDLKAKTVTTVAGTGKQATDPGERRLAQPAPAKGVALNSPWDVLLVGDQLFIAMAGHHQIWVLDLTKYEAAPYAGSGRENIGDGPLSFAMLAQPSGLATDGKSLFVADSEISALREVPLGGKGEVKTLVGRGLFVFGDRDGPARVDDPLQREATEARLQHALGVAYAKDENKLYVADTYNSKIRVYDPAAKTLTTLIGGAGGAGWFTAPQFSEPAGISYADGKLYVADTNAHRVRVVDVRTRAVSTLRLRGVEPPAAPPAPAPAPKDEKR
jgi:DNA-binding beta-propeller fold protein YncE